MSAKVLCGPVIGLVTADSAIILLEIDCEQTVTISLFDGQSSVAFNSIELSLPRRCPRVFKFTGLDSETKYYINVENVKPLPDPRGRFRTLPRDPQNVKVAALSCNFPERETREDMWKKLYHQAKVERLDAILHLGDNVYIDGAVSDGLSNAEQVRDSAGIFNAERVDQDTPYVCARRLLVGLSDTGDWETKREEIVEIYRARYRFTWGRKYTALVLRSFSNLMILDDHEIRDDFGLRKEDSDPESVEYWLGMVAVQVYHEYQRQLWDPDILSTDKQTSLHNEFYSVNIGPLGIAMMDVRTPMSIYRPRREENDDSYYGIEQMESFKESLSGATDGNTRMWIVCCALPLMFFKKDINKVLTKLDKTADDLKAFLRRGEKDLRPIWKTIRGWKKEKGKSSDVIVLAGDVHIGGFTDIFCPADDDDDRKELLCHQITTSPIHNKLWSDAQNYFVKLALETGDQKLGDLTYQHYNWINSCNFAIIRADFHDPDRLGYTLSLMAEQGKSINKSSGDPRWFRPAAVRFFRNLLCIK